MAGILETRELCKYFRTPRGLLHAVEGVNLSIQEGKTLDRVLQIHLWQIASASIGEYVGQILFKGKDVTNIDRRGLRNCVTIYRLFFKTPTHL